MTADTLLKIVAMLFTGGGIYWIAQRYHIPFGAVVRSAKQRGGQVAIQLVISNDSQVHMSAFGMACRVGLDAGPNRRTTVASTAPRTLEPGSELVVAFLVKAEHLGSLVQVEIRYRTLLRRLTRRPRQVAYKAVTLR